LLASSMFALFLYNGYDAIVKVHDEVIDPNQIPNAIMISLTITTIIYIIISWITQQTLSAKQLSTTYTPLSDIFKINLTRYDLGKHAYQISFLVGLVIMFNTAFVSLLCGTRYMYGMAKTNHIPSIFAETNRYHAPHYAIAISTLIMLFFCIVNNENIAIIVTNVCVILLLLLINAGLLVLRIKTPPKGYQMPLYVRGIPVLTLIPILGFSILLVYSIINYSKYIYVN